MDKSLGTIHGGPTPPLTPQTTLDACIENIFWVSTLYSVAMEGGGGGGELQENFEKEALFWDITKKGRKIWILQYCTKDFCSGS